MIKDFDFITKFLILLLALVVMFAIGTAFKAGPKKDHYEINICNGEEDTNPGIAFDGSGPYRICAEFNTRLSDSCSCSINKLPGR